MSQRDLLAAALHKAAVLAHAWADCRACDPFYREADALHARGVRLVTVETLAAALLDVHSRWDPYIARSEAAAILAALDEPTP